MRDRTDIRLVPHPLWGFLQVVPTPDAEAIDRYYREHFYSGEYKSFNNSSSAAQERDRAFNDAHRDDVWAALVDSGVDLPAGSRVLDVGCGFGQALEYFRNKMLVPFGIDPAPEAVRHAQSLGLNVVEAGIDALQIFGQRFDLVSMFHVVEHVADPILALETIRSSVLTENGHLIVEVPNEFNAFQVAARDLYGLPEWWVSPPAHLNYFSTATLRNTLEGCGFEVVAMQSTFPMEMLLLMGMNYVSDDVVGAEAHKLRVAFETNVREMGAVASLRQLYAALAEIGLGRTVVAIARRA